MPSFRQERNPAQQIGPSPETLMFGVRRPELRAVQATCPTIDDREAGFRREPDPDSGHDFSRVHVYPKPWHSGHDSRALALLPPMQAKLEVGSVNDPLEHEADRVAERVMRIPDPTAMLSTPHKPVGQRDSGASAGVGHNVQRKCAACSEEEQQTVRRKCQSCAEEENKKDEDGKISRKPSGDGTALDGKAAPTIVQDALRSSSRSLDSSTRAFFEPRFGHGFGRVRVHSDAVANSSASAVGARAYTVGHQIVFAAGQYAPATTEGAKLLAHELTHVVQQNSGAAAPARRQVLQREPEVKADPGATCSMDQHRKIEPAAFKAREWLSRTLGAVNEFIGGAKTRNAGAASAAFNKHFHSTDASVVAYVKARLSTILDEMFNRRTLHVNCPPASDTVCGKRGQGQELVARVPEHVKGSDQDEIDFCQPFFERSVEDCASTLIHELGHAQAGLTQKQEIVDRAYQGDSYYSYLTTGEALTNAEAYAMFAREVATGSSGAKGPISDTVDTDCPDSWSYPVQVAMNTARMWNHRAALKTPATHEFSRVYKTLDAKLTSEIDFKCITDGGGRCGNPSYLYWYAAGRLRVCPLFVQIPSPERRAQVMLATLYGYESLIDDNDKQNRAALEAQRLHSTDIPSTADVLSGK